MKRIQKITSKVVKNKYQLYSLIQWVQHKITKLDPLLGMNKKLNN
jgi:hypothetical protein